MTTRRRVTANRPDASAYGSRPDEKNLSSINPASTSWKVNAVWCVGTVASNIMVGLVALVLGGIIGQQQLYQSWTNRKLERLESILSSGDFEGIEAGYSSAARVYLKGRVQDSAALAALRNQLVVAFGSEESDEIMASVDVEQ